MPRKKLVRNLDPRIRVDKSDLWLLDGYWRIAHHGYVIRDPGDYLHHHIIGRPLPGFVVDHINQDKLDNRKRNLRIIPKYVNHHNMGPTKVSTTKHKGIRLIPAGYKAGGRYVAYITVQMKRKHIGNYGTLQEAIAARRAWQEKHIPNWDMTKEIQ